MRYILNNACFKIMVKELLSKKFMILIEVATGDYYNLNQIGEKIGITKQGVYEYLKKMREEGLIDIIEGKYKATFKGIETLFSYLNEIDAYLKNKKDKLNLIEGCSAIAGEDIKKDDKVSIFMENGYLYAYKSRKANATANAMEDARKGEDVLIKNIRGIINLQIGKIFLFSLPSANKGGAKKIDTKKLREKIEEIKADRIGIMDVIGKVAIEKAGLKYDIEFSPAQAAIEGVKRGLNIALLGEEKEVRRAIMKIEEYNANSIENIEYEVIKIS